MTKEIKLASVISVMYRIDGGAKANTFNPGPHQLGLKTFPILLDRNGHVDIGKTKRMIQADLELFQANFDRSEPFRYIENGPIIDPQQIGFVSYKLILARVNKSLTEIGSRSWNRLEGRWRGSNRYS